MIFLFGIFQIDKIDKIMEFWQNTQERKRDPCKGIEGDTAMRIRTFGFSLSCACL